MDDDDIHEKFDLSDVVPARRHESEDDHELDDLLADLISRRRDH